MGQCCSRQCFGWFQMAILLSRCTYSQAVVVEPIRCSPAALLPWFIEACRTFSSLNYDLDQVLNGLSLYSESHSDVPNSLKPPLVSLRKLARQLPQEQSFSSKVSAPFILSNPHPQHRDDLTGEQEAVRDRRGASTHLPVSLPPLLLCTLNCFPSFSLDSTSSPLTSLLPTWCMCQKRRTEIPKSRLSLPMPALWFCDPNDLAYILDFFFFFTL